MLILKKLGKNTNSVLTDENGVPLSTVSGAGGPTLAVSSETTVTGVVSVREQNLDNEGYIRNSSHNMGKHDGAWTPFAVDDLGRQRMVLETVPDTHTLSGTQHTGQLMDSQIPDTIVRDSEFSSSTTTLQSGIDSKSNLGHTHVESNVTDLDKYTQAEVDALFVATSGTFQSQFNNLDTNYISEVEFTGYYNSLQSDIGDKADLVHSHDGRYYTEAEMDTTLSGKSDTNHQHVESDITGLDKYTQAEVDSLVSTTSGSLQNQITSLDLDYVTEQEFTVYSGTLQSGIDDKSDINHTHDNRYYTESEVDTIITSISGVLSDTTPQLGGNLDLNNHDISGTGNIDIDGKIVIDTTGSDVTPLEILTNGSAGNYTPANSAIFIKDAAGDEIIRIWGSDPDYINNYNSSNLYIGFEAGKNQSTDNSSAGYLNTGVGWRALSNIATGAVNTAFGGAALADTTIGQANTAFGISSLASNIDGNENSACGGYAIVLNTSGSNNSALGMYSLYSNTEGDSNSASGYNALGGNTTGNFNSALGSQAGLYITGGSAYNATSSNSVYLGTNTRAFASGSTNEIVIGYGVTGSGSNTVVLGDDAITATHLKGNVSVAGTLSISAPVSGDHAANKDYVDTVLSTVSGIQTFLDLADTPTTYSGGQFAQSTSSGIVWADATNYVTQEQINFYTIIDPGVDDPYIKINKKVVIIKEAHGKKPTATSSGTQLTTKDYVDETVADSVEYSWTLPSDHTYKGDTIIAPAGESLGIGDVCYLKSDGNFWKTNAGAEATSKGLVVMSTGTTTVSGNGTFLLKGMIRDDSWNWNVGSELWLHTTSGALTETKPSTTGDIVRLAGYARGADYVWFDPDKTYIEVA